MNEDFPTFNLGLDEYLKPEWQKTEETRFVKLNDDELDDLIEGAPARSLQSMPQTMLCQFSKVIFQYKYFCEIQIFCT